MQHEQASAQARYVRIFLISLGAMLAFALLVLAPYSLWWLHASGDAAVERAVAAQARGDFALFGSGLSQDFVDYKLRLYAAAKPEIAAVGSSRVMQFRSSWFRQSFINLGGAAGNLAVLKSTINAMLSLSRPKAVIIGLDFWWFMPQWEKDPHAVTPPTSGTYNYSLESLKKPWEWLFSGKISFRDMFAPVLGWFGAGFRADAYGIMAQQTRDGFGPDGSWYYTAEITGQKPAFDYLFHDTLENVRNGTKAFFHAPSGQKAPAAEHLEVLAEIMCRLKSLGIQVFTFIPPLSEKVLEAMGQKEYPHLYNLRESLASLGIDALDFSNPATLGANDCEFVDGFHGGEVVYARILRRMADHWPGLLAYVNMEKLEHTIRDWKGHALVPDPRLTERAETDFLGLGCEKRPPWRDLQDSAKQQGNLKVKK